VSGCTAPFSCQRRTAVISGRETIVGVTGIMHHEQASRTCTYPLHLVFGTCNQMTASQNRKQQQALYVRDANAAPAPHLL
jgi:hypothetical protein